MSLYDEYGVEQEYLNMSLMRFQRIEEAAQALINDVRKRYNMSIEEKFNCPFMNALDVELKS